MSLGNVSSYIHLLLQGRWGKQFVSDLPSPILQMTGVDTPESRGRPLEAYPGIPLMAQWQGHWGEAALVPRTFGELR